MIIMIIIIVIIVIIVIAGWERQRGGGGRQRRKLTPPSWVGLSKCPLGTGGLLLRGKSFTGFQTGSGQAVFVIEVP